MPIIKRLIYALYLFIVITAAVMLFISVGEGIAFVQGVNVQELMFHPLYVGLTYGASFAIAPVLSERIPISGDQNNEVSRSRIQVGYTVRSFLLVALGLVLAFVANLVVGFLR